MQRTERLLGAVRQGQHGLGALRKQHGGLAAAVGVTHNAPLRHLKRLSGVRQIDGADLWVERDQHDVFGHGEVLPRHVELPLGGEETGFGVVEGQQAAAVDCEVELAIGTAQCLAELGVVLDGDGHARQGGVGLVPHGPAEHGGTLRFDRALGDAGLDRVGTGVQEFCCIGHRGGDGRIEGRGHLGGIRRQVSAAAAADHDLKALAGRTAPPVADRDGDGKRSFRRRRPLDHPGRDIEAHAGRRRGETENQDIAVGIGGVDIVNIALADGRRGQRGGRDGR